LRWSGNTPLGGFARAGGRQTGVQRNRRAIHCDEGVRLDICLCRCVGRRNRGEVNGFPRDRTHRVDQGRCFLRGIRRTSKANASGAAFAILRKASGAVTGGAVHGRARVGTGSCARTHLAAMGILEHPVGTIHRARHLRAARSSSNTNTQTSADRCRHTRINRHARGQARAGDGFG